MYSAVNEYDEHVCREDEGTHNWDTHTPHRSRVAHLYNDYTTYNTISLNISTQEATTLTESICGTCHMAYILTF